MQLLINQFEVTIIKKVPYITEFLFFLLAPGLVVLLIVLFVVVPSAQSSKEMIVVSLINFLPANLQFILLYLAGSTVILYPLYKYVKIHKTATLMVNNEFLSLRGKNVNHTIPTTRVCGINFKNPTNFRGHPTEKLIIYVREKFSKTITLKLNNFSEAEALIHHLSTIENFKPLLSGFDPLFYIEAED